jgi:hypothetical protein
LNKLVLTYFCTTSFAADAIMDAADAGIVDYSNYRRFLLLLI